jgi:hypothetical protein
MLCNFIDMRLLAKDHVGLHPAFPDIGPPFTVNSTLIGAVTGAKLGSLAGLATLLTSSGRLKWALSSSLAASSFIGLTTVFWFVGTVEDTPPKAFLKERGIDVPKKTRYFERLGRFDQDNAAIGGAIAGAVIGGILLRRRNVLGIQNYVAGAAYGCCIGDLSYLELYKLRYGNEKFQQAALREHEARQWKHAHNPLLRERHARKTATERAELRSGLWYHLSLEADDTGANTPIRVVAFREARPKEAVTFGKPQYGWDLLGMEILSHLRFPDGLYSTAKDGLDEEGQLNSTKDFTFQSSQNNIAELEIQVQELEVLRRDKLVQSEYVQRWLAEQEAEHVTRRDENSRERKERQR